MREALHKGMGRAASNLCLKACRGTMTPSLLFILLSMGLVWGNCHIAGAFLRAIVRVSTIVKDDVTQEIEDLP